MPVTADVSSLINLTLEGVSDEINENLITSDSLISMFRNGRAQRVSNRLYRIVQQIALAGGDSRSVAPDGGALPLGSFSQYIAGGVTPISITSAMNWTELMALVGVKVDGVAIQNAISKGLGDLTTMMKNWEDIGMHTDGTGTLATLSAAPPNANTVNLSATPFGARNIEIGQTVDIVNPTGNVTRCSLTVLNKGALLGAQQYFISQQNAQTGTTGNGNPATSDIVRYGGLVDGVPKWLNGLRYLISYSTTGELHGVPRSTPQVVANGFDMGGSAITRSAIQLLLSQRRARIKESEVGTDFWYTHDSQVNSLKEIGYDLEYIPLSGGTAEGFDPFFRGAPTIEGKPIKWGQHADQQAWYLIAPKAVGRVMFKEPYFPLVNGSRVYNTYNSGGTPNLQYASAYLNFEQFFTDLAPAHGVITGAGVPAGTLQGF
jgi:hypothetical protein